MPQTPFTARAIDGLAFSNGIPAAIAAALSLVASLGLGARNGLLWAGLAACGAFVVYGLDRLRDTDRDRATSPIRTGFVERYRTALSIAVAGAAVGLLTALFAAPGEVVLLCSGVGAIGLLHRRLKGFAALKTAYVSLAWVAVCAGIPWIAEGGRGLGWIGAVLFTTLAANLIASNLRDDEAQRLADRPGRAIAFARSTAALGVLLALIAPTSLLPLVWIPVGEALALVFFRPTEHYGHLAVDGALLVGALASLCHFAMT